MTIIQEPDSKNNTTLVNEASRQSGRGARNASTYNILHGINHRFSGVSPAPANQDSVGFTFFTKPVLNLAYNNISGIRKLEFLGDNDPKSMGCAIKSMLSPYVVRNVPYWDSTDNIRSAIVDDHYPFIPLLSNTLLNISGWPDMSPETYTTDEGIAKESTSWIDGRGDIYNTFDLTANFRNLDGDPVTALMDAWVYYSSKVAEGAIVPYAEMMVENEIDYMTRIYRLVMNKEQTHVTKIACTGAAFPFAVPNGASFNFETTAVVSKENEQISIPFRCIGAIYNDPIIIREFNDTVEMFQPFMREENRDKEMTKLKRSELPLFNFKGYPRIESDNELTWWVTNATYKSMFTEG